MVWQSGLEHVDFPCSFVMMERITRSLTAFGCVVAKLQSTEVQEMMSVRFHREHQVAFVKLLVAAAAFVDAPRLSRAMCAETVCKVMCHMGDVIDESSFQALVGKSLVKLVQRAASRCIVRRFFTTLQSVACNRYVVSATVRILATLSSADRLAIRECGCITRASLSKALVRQTVVGELDWFEHIDAALSVAFTRCRAGLEAGRVAADTCGTLAVALRTSTVCEQAVAPAPRRMCSSSSTRGGSIEDGFFSIFSIIALLHQLKTLHRDCCDGVAGTGAIVAALTSEGGGVRHDEESNEGEVPPARKRVCVERRDDVAAADCADKEPVLSGAMVLQPSALATLHLMWCVLDDICSSIARITTMLGETGVEARALLEVTHSSECALASLRSGRVVTHVDLERCRRLYMQRKAMIEGLVAPHVSMDTLAAVLGHDDSHSVGVVPARLGSSGSRVMHAGELSSSAICACCIKHDVLAYMWKWLRPQTHYVITTWCDRV